MSYRLELANKRAITQHFDGTAPLYQYVWFVDGGPDIVLYESYSLEQVYIYAVLHIDPNDEQEED